MATVKSIIEDAYTKVNGEFEAVTEGSDDFKTYLNVLNQTMRSLAHTPYVKWQSFFDMEHDLPNPVVSGTLSYTIPNFSDITISNSPYDHVFFIDGTGAVVAKYKLVSLPMFQATTNTQVCAIAGDKIYLKATEDKIIGATIRLPVYKDPALYTTASQTVTVDNAQWLVTSMAAFICDASPVPFIARNADKFAKEAAVFMKEMRDNNRRTQNLIIKSLNSSTNHTWADVMNTMTMKDL